MGWIKELRLEIFDSHIHLDIMMAREIEGVRDFFRENRMGGIVWSFNQKIEEPEGLVQYFEGLHRMARDFQSEGIPIYYLVGVHPRCFSHQMANLSNLRERLWFIYEQFLCRKECLGIGEIGLEKGTQEEERILRAQLELAPLIRRYGKRIGIHTPRRDKENITRKTLDIIMEYPFLKGDILVDHCTPRTIGMVLSEGLFVGVTMSPVKCQIHDLIEILTSFPEGAEMICLNTDASEIYWNLLEVAESNLIDNSVKELLLRENALKFWRVPWPGRMEK